MSDLKQPSLADWQALVAKELAGADAATLDWLTPEGLLIKPLYTAADLEGLASAAGPNGSAAWRS